ncbi:hypothetical protein MRB53_028553 [Persea americana]|uniref:Uncharacterized protein n=1 Tax=Persea americana TaxID=3435 RepID=A0ACC2KGE0_PERAE|nr:hypothetical protein MRB53_028553 [Persea americana]
MLLTLPSKSRRVLWALWRKRRPGIASSPDSKRGPKGTTREVDRSMTSARNSKGSIRSTIVPSPAPAPLPQPDAHRGPRGLVLDLKGHKMLLALWSIATRR